MADLFDVRAFTLGMVALVNPCGFALLPAYLGFFLGLDEEEDASRIVALNRAQIVGLSMSAGFLAVFGLLGIVLSGLLNSIIAQLSWFTIVMGVLLAILGVAMAFGFKPMVRIPQMNKGTESNSSFSMFLFGISYAVASLSCTIGLFISAVATSTTNDGFIAKFGAFISYGAGMGLIAMVLTLAMALGKRGVINGFRKLLPYINTISAVVLVIVGIYLVLYGVWQRQIFGGQVPTAWINTIVSAVENTQGRLTVWIDGRVGILGWSFLVINLGLVAAGFIAKRSAKPSVAT